jgi:hypothetical protein
MNEDKKVQPTFATTNTPTFIEQFPTLKAIDESVFYTIYEGFFGLPNLQFRNEFYTRSALFPLGESLKFSQSEIDSSLEILSEEGFLECVPLRRTIDDQFLITVKGAVIYADMKVPEFRKVVRKVANHLMSRVGGQDTESIAIEIREPVHLVRLAFEDFKSRGFIQAQDLSMGMLVVSVSPRLARTFE